MRKGLLTLILVCTIHITPRFQLAKPFGDHYPVRVRIDVNDPKLRLGNCPSFTWSWGDGSKSEQISDCAPDGGRARKFSETRTYVYRAPGRYAILVQIKGNGREVKLEGFAEIKDTGAEGSEAGQLESWREVPSPRDKD
jgi:hypothetical protein